MCAVSWLLLTPFLLAVTVILLIRYKHNYWRRRHMPTESLASQYKWRNREHLIYTQQRIYDKLKAAKRRFVGAYLVLSPNLIVTDLDLLRKIYISNFQAFPDRGLYHNYKHDPLSRNLLRVHADLWRKMRARLTPTFTAGKMKMMFRSIESIGQHFVKAINEHAESSSQEVELKDLCARFTTDIIGRVAFGLECNSLGFPDTAFRVMAAQALRTLPPLLESIGVEYLGLFNKMGLKTFSNKAIDFYGRIVRENVELRRQSGLKYNDFLDLLIEMMNGKDVDDESRFGMTEVVAQAFIFFVAGFDTSSSAMSFAMYELAHHQEIQQKARNNIEEVLARHGGMFTYDAVHEMDYIKQVVQEALRKHPVAPVGRRICRKAIRLADDLFIEPGVHIMTPVYAIHNDPDYYPEPQLFRPERFAPGEREKRHPMAYMPFGAGPRSCIAERFGMMQTMLGISLMLHHFKFSISENTPKQMTFDAYISKVLAVKEGFYFKVEKV